MRRIGIYVKKDAEAISRADALEKWLISKEIDVLRVQSYGPEDTEKEAAGIEEKLADEFICVFVLGGDGTFLSASRWLGAHKIPLIGAKFGDVGFMAEITGETLFAAAQRILENEYVIAERSRLLVKVVRAGSEIAEETVLNDVVINKGALARLANIETYINDHYLTTYRSDGLIVATPTGSTAYSLAAGGPVMHPGVQGIIINPICPFTLTNRCMILPNTVNIKIRLAKKTTDVFITFDGQQVLEITDQDVVLITKSPHPLKIINFPDQNYFDILKAKLLWSGGPLK